MVQYQLGDQDSGSQSLIGQSLKYGDHGTQTSKSVAISNAMMV